MRNKTFSFLFFLISSLAITPAFSTQSISEEKESDKNLALVLTRSTVLDMTSVIIEDKHAIKLADVLKNNSVITQLYFQQSRISNAGIKVLAETFETLPKLIQLYLCGNCFDNIGATDLFMSLKKVKSLQLLDIRNNLFSDDILPLLADLLKENPELKLYINLSNFKQTFNS